MQALCYLLHLWRGSVTSQTPWLAQQHMHCNLQETRLRSRGRTTGLMMPSARPAMNVKHHSVCLCGATTAASAGASSAAAAPSTSYQRPEMQQFLQAGSRRGCVCATTVSARNKSSTATYAKHWNLTLACILRDNPLVTAAAAPPMLVLLVCFACCRQLVCKHTHTRSHRKCT